MDAAKTLDPDYPAGAPDMAHASRPSVMDAARAVDAEEAQRGFALRASAMALILMRGKFESRSLPVAADMQDYEAIVRIVERPAP